MVMKKNVRKGKGARKGKGVRRGRAPRRRNFNEKERASLTEISQSGGVLSSNQNYGSYNISLTQLPRAQNIAKGYQFYRIRRVTYVIKPTMDTFVAGGPSVPYLYYMIDRVKQFVNGFSIDQLKAMGAKPRRLDDKTLMFSYTPSVLTETFDNTAGANTAVQYKLCPWLPTKDTAQVGVWNPNSTDHLGIVWRLEQSIGQQVGYTVERRIEVEFKKPSIPTYNTAPEDVPIDFDVANPPVPAVQA